mmetsp:Transcript_43218/g.69626  ORF Transcript_43218/g.69626 Transcript_43218/m.69626 type:complete len:176 (-) Transcript_43218:316-843(-)|eukprot:jgi/Bigna1/91236/estExt_fgenesh1_pg.C_940004
MSGEEKQPLQPSATQDFSIDIEFAPVEELKASTVCCCCMQSFYTSWPGCCGVQGSCSFYICQEQISMKCLQTGPETRTCIQRNSYLKCIDMTKGPYICIDGAHKFILCFCAQGIEKFWCGGCTDEDPVKPCEGKGNCLCIDLRCALPPSSDMVTCGFACCGAPIYPKDYSGGSMS